ARPRRPGGARGGGGGPRSTRQAAAGPAPTLVSISRTTSTTRSRSPTRTRHGVSALTRATGPGLDQPDDLNDPLAVADPDADGVLDLDRRGRLGPHPVDLHVAGPAGLGRPPACLGLRAPPQAA